MCSFIEFNNDVHIAFILLIDHVEWVDIEFKLLNMVVDVAFISLIDNIDFVEI